ncbi:kinesin-like protein KIF6 isoform X3 [Meriones unguiculatus]|nr:kinesin-like protein KIF6 isoform X3 [Meriones unguiculatus]
MREGMSLGRQEAFEIFKRDHADSVTIDDNKQILKQRFSEAKALGESINGTRSKIGQLKEAITQRHLQKAALGLSRNMVTPDMPDPQEEKLRVQLEEEKSRYKMTFTRLKALKVEIEHLQLLMDKAKVKLQKEFEAWWAEEATNLEANPPATKPQESMKPCTQVDQTQRLSKKSSGGWEAEDGTAMVDVCDKNARRILPSPCPSQPSQESGGSRAQQQDSIPERPVSSIPLTGDSQIDSDILAFIKARQNVLQKKCLGNN